MKRLLILLLMLTVILSACGTSSPGGKETGATTTTTSTVDVAEEKGPITLTAGKGLDVSAALSKLPEGHDIENNNYYLNYVKETCNVTFKYEWVLTDDAQRVSLAIASGKIPDVMTVDLQTFNMLRENDLIQSLDSAWEKGAGDFLKSVAQSYPRSFASATVDGKLMAIPETQSPHTQQMLWVRQDWLEKLGRKVPTTLDELVETAKAFIKDDPDGNKKDDTYGLVLGKTVFPAGTPQPGADIIANSFGAYPKMWYQKEDGSVVYGTVTNETREALQYLAKLYADGIIDPEFAVRDYKELLTSGKAGLVYGIWMFAGGLRDSHAYDGADWVPTLCPLADDGSYYCSGEVPAYKYVVVSKDCKYPERVIEVIDAEHTFVQMRTGDEKYIEQMKEYQALGAAWFPMLPIGINLEREDVVAVRAEAMNQMVEKNGDRSGVSEQNQMYYDAWLQYQADPTYLLGWYYYKAAYFGANVATYDKAKYTYPCFWGSTKTMTESWATLQKMEEEIILKVVMGEASIEDYDTFVKKWYDLGGKQITAEVQEYVDNR